MAKELGLIGAFTSMRPGQSMVYYTGITGWNNGPAFASLNQWFADAQASGEWDFVQRRIGEPNIYSQVSVYEYTIIRRKTPHRPDVIPEYSRFRRLLRSQ